MAERLQPVLSRIDALKRQLYDALTNPRDYASMLGGRIQESGQAAKQLQSQAFADPRQPFKVTNEAALRQLTDMMMAGPLGFAPAGITAYHGSPYLFKQFDPMKVGTGEGAQAYGVGAGYTAQARPVAEEYRKMLTSWRPDQIESSLIESGLSPELANTYAQFAAQTKGKAPSFESFKQLISEKSPSPYIEQFRESLRKELPDLEKALSGKSGYLYKGDIPDEILPKFLDWDKPLNQQTPEVRSALEKLGFKVDKKEVDDFTDALLSALEGTGSTNLPKEPINPTGASIYRKLAERGDFDTASKKLDEIGIRGIRYLDQGSRSEGKGTSNFVPFRPEDFKIQEINDIPLEEYIAKGLLSP